MPYLATGSFNENILQSFNRLLNNMLTILTISSEPLVKLVVMADKIHEFTIFLQIHHIQTPDTSIVSQQQQIKAFLEQVVTLTGRPQYSLHGLTYLTNRDPQWRHNYLFRLNKTLTSGICFYHHNFADGACKCFAPWNFIQNFLKLSGPSLEVMSDNDRERCIARLFIADKSSDL
ncbi:hypothetical protein NPIL_545671 [Nephila pilipes]|uniref:Uncharacterized protein n=1 Tax=Nephila pilipes TaxID=299642 RepID=A0A8X6PM72_NEPPI|nr:hypothetical protein NPIL_545671 [Nephila pilipes]